MGGKRSVRVGEQLLQEIADLLEHKVRDPRVKGVTLTGVRLSRDLKSAKVFFSSMGEAFEIENAQKGLDSATGFIKREIGLRLELRYMPEIEFRHDPSLQYGEDMEKIIDGLNLPKSEDED
ncbi:MAG: 30S ribosome-binding factor RbfA [Desulfobacteraceae bacterium]